MTRTTLSELVHDTFVSLQDFGDLHSLADTQTLGDQALALNLWERRNEEYGGSRLRESPISSKMAL